MILTLSTNELEEKYSEDQFNDTHTHTRVRRHCVNTKNVCWYVSSWLCLCDSQGHLETQSADPEHSDGSSHRYTHHCHLTLWKTSNKHTSRSNKRWQFLWVYLDEEEEEGKEALAGRKMEVRIQLVCTVLFTIHVVLMQTITR